MTITHPLAFASSVLPLLGWLGYNWLVNWVERRHPSLSILMSSYRRGWVENAVQRQSPMDALLASNLMGSISFFASTTVLIILGVFAMFAQMQTITDAVAHIQFNNPPVQADIERHMIIALIMFGMAFLSFTLSIRQFNHFCIMLGAASHDEETDPAEIRVITALNTLGARNFNHGIRAYYFAVPMVIWFVSPWLSLAATLFIFGAIIYREFFSAARSLVAELDKDR